MDNKKRSTLAAKVWRLHSMGLRTDQIANKLNISETKVVLILGR